MAIIEPLIAIHGGAGGIQRKNLSHRDLSERRQTMVQALRHGQSLMKLQAPAVKIAVEIICILEDSPLFNAGRGAVLCNDGTVELCAGLMDSNGRAGCVAQLTRVRNPIRAAELILDERHVFLSGPPAERWAADAGLEHADPQWFITGARQEQWKRASGSGLDHDAPNGDTGCTVGAVVRDAQGLLCAATSTGGMVRQPRGRIGDTPSIGAGTWASGHCAISATGDGDIFLRAAFARHVADLIELTPASLEDACGRALALVGEMGGRGGCIAIGPTGAVAMPMNSSGMYRGWIGPIGPAHLAVFADEPGQPYP